MTFSLFESPTIAGLASVVSEIYPEQNGSEELGQMLAEIEKLSAEEIELRLNQG
jgi:hypothetical protein